MAAVSGNRERTLRRTDQRARGRRQRERGRPTGCLQAAKSTAAVVRTAALQAPFRIPLHSALHSSRKRGERREGREREKERGERRVMLQPSFPLLSSPSLPPALPLGSCRQTLRPAPCKPLRLCRHRCLRLFKRTRDVAARNLRPTCLLVRPCRRPLPSAFRRQCSEAQQKHTRGTDSAGPREQWRRRRQRSC